MRVKIERFLNGFDQPPTSVKEVTLQDGFELNDKGERIGYHRAPFHMLQDGAAFLTSGNRYTMISGGKKPAETCQCCGATKQT